VSLLHFFYLNIHPLPAIHTWDESPGVVLLEPLCVLLQALVRVHCSLHLLDDLLLSLFVGACDLVQRIIPSNT